MKAVSVIFDYMKMVERNERRVNSLSSGGVDQQSDESRRTRANTVQSQHGILKLFLTHHMICRHTGKKGDNETQVTQAPQQNTDTETVAIFTFLKPTAVQ